MTASSTVASTTRRVLSAALALLLGAAALMALAHPASALQPQPPGGPGGGGPPEPPPVARFSVSQNPAILVDPTGVSIGLDASASTDDDAIAKYEWDLDGNGTFERSGATLVKPSAHSAASARSAWSSRSSRSPRRRSRSWPPSWARGTITTVAGVGAGFAGDGDPASTARLRAPFSVAALPHRGFLFADTANHRVRRVTPLGAIFTVAGGAAGNAGNGGLAKTALLNQPGAVTVAPGGGFLVADTGNATVRRVSDVGAVPAAVFGRSVGVAPAVGGVTVRPAGVPAFLALQEEDLVPTRSDIESTGGQIAITTARDASGTQQTAQVYRGPFSVAYRATGSTAFRVSPLTGCGTGAARAASPRVGARIAAVTDKRRKAKRKKPRRKTASHSLWVSETGGNWQTATGAVSAAAIGTRWHTTLSCEGTRVTIAQGIVRVRDKLHQRTVVLRVGQTYLAQTRRSHRGQ